MLFIKSRNGRLKSNNCDEKCFFGRVVKNIGVKYDNGKKCQLHHEMITQLDVFYISIFKE